MPRDTAQERPETLDWLSQFTLIRSLIERHIPTGRGGKFSAQAAEKFLGVTPKKWSAWEKGQRPSAGDLEIIGRVLGLQPQWLLFGEGEPFMPDNAAATAARTLADAHGDAGAPRTDAAEAHAAQGKAAPISYEIPYIPPSGLAECPSPVYAAPLSLPVTALSSTGGDWYSAAALPLRQALPSISPHWLSVQLPDNRMAQAGLHAGEMLYCDPHSMPRTGDAVCVTRTDGTVGIRIWLGCEADELLLRGCHADGSPFEERLAAAQVRQVAPVIFVQRRV